MGNKWKGTFEVKIGGKEYTLRPSFEAMCAFEDRTGLDITKVCDDVISSGHASAKVTVAAIHSGIFGETIAANKEDGCIAYELLGEQMARTGITRYITAVQAFLLYATTAHDIIDKQMEKEDEKKTDESPVEDMSGGDSSDA